MKPIRIIACLLLGACQMNAQDVAEKQSSNLKVGITGSADYCSYLLYYNNEFQSVADLFYAEKPSVGWSSGITAEYSLSSNWSVTGGLRYTEHNIVVGPITFTDASGNMIGEMKMRYHNRFIDLPIGIQYNTDAAKKLNFIANVSMTPGYALGEWVAIDFNGDVSTGFTDSHYRSDIENFNYFSLKAEVYAGIGLNFEKFQLDILPQARMNLRKVTSETSINRRYWTTGIEFRVLYNL
jgi:hypothetical protein